MAFAILGLDFRAILRPSTKLAAKLNVTPSKVLPLDQYPVADWSAHYFTAERTPFGIAKNTASLESTVFQ
jgi:hypothetical protein